MSGQATHTKSSGLGTFGEKRVNCLYDGSTMREYLRQEVTAETEQVVLRCPNCGWMATFLNRKEG